VAVPRRPTEVPTTDSRTPIRAFAKENAQVSQTRSSAWWLLLVPVSLALLVVLTAEKKRSEPPKTEVAYPSVVAELGAPPVASPPPLPVPVPEAAPAAQYDQDGALAAAKTVIDEVCAVVNTAAQEIDDSGGDARRGTEAAERAGIAVQQALHKRDLLASRLSERGKQDLHEYGAPRIAAAMARFQPAVDRMRSSGK
jgi:hypothetical protein